MNERSEVPMSECICQDPNHCRTCQREASEAHGLNPGATLCPTCGDNGTEDGCRTCGELDAAARKRAADDEAYWRQQYDAEQAEPKNPCDDCGADMDQRGMNEMGSGCMGYICDDCRDDRNQVAYDKARLYDQTPLGRSARRGA